MKEDQGQDQDAIQETIEQFRNPRNHNVETVYSNEMFRSTALSFMSEQFKDVTHQQRLRRIFEEALIQAVEYHEMDTTEILNAWKAVSKEKTSSMQSILDVFKPNSNSPHPLIAPIKEESGGDVDKIAEKMTSKQLQAMDDIVKILKVVAEQEGSNDEA